MNAVQLLEQTKTYVTRYYSEHATKKHTFHNFGFAVSVVDNCREILERFTLPLEEGVVVRIAAWFYGTGFLTDTVEPIEKSVAIAESFFSKLHDQREIETEVKMLLRGTVDPQLAEDHLQDVLCDAVHYHYGTKKFMELEKLLRKEATYMGSVEMDRASSLRQQIALLSGYTYRTSCCRGRLQVQKTINLKALNDKLMEILIAETSQFTLADKKDRPERGIDTMFKIASGNNQRLSEMADNKAHILITVNAIILSAIISLVLRRLEETPFLALPSLILLAVCIWAMVLSILATRPTISAGKFSARDLEETKVNLLYFGNFHGMDQASYSAGMFRAMNDSTFLYGMLTRDLHAQGVVLGRKYILLRYAYNIFMYGLMISVIIFIAFSIINQYYAL